MNCSLCSEVADSARWLSSGEHSASYSPERGCQWWTDPWGTPATRTFESHQAWWSFFSPHPWRWKTHKTQEVDNEVLGLKYSFVCLLYTWVSSVRRSFCINHFMILSISASLPLRLFRFGVTTLTLEVLSFFFFLRKVSRALWLCYHQWLDDPSQYDTIISARQMQTVSESPESYDSMHLLTQHWYIRENDPPRKYFFVPGPITKPLLSWS